VLLKPYVPSEIDTLDMFLKADDDAKRYQFYLTNRVVITKIGKSLARKIWIAGCTLYKFQA
jgi:hypothetical protein